jgi:hypothetical protein
MDKSSEYALMLIALTMEAVRTSETPVYFSETTRRYIPEGCLSSSYSRPSEPNISLLHLISIAGQET